MLRAQRVHRAHHEPNTVQMSTLLSIKTGACPEDCAYCPQSVRYDTGLAPEALLEVGAVRAHAARAKAAVATRFCMGAAYRSPKARDLQVIVQMVREVRALGLESCATLGMLTSAQAAELKAAGLDYYNHNLDTSAEYYARIITTRTYQDRLHTLAAGRAAGPHAGFRRRPRPGRGGPPPPPPRSAPPAPPPGGPGAGGAPRRCPLAMKRAAPALEAALSRLAQRQLARARTTLEAFAAAGSRVVALAGGRELIDFSSNDYLGLARHPGPAAAMSACAARTGAGSGASHLVSGHGAEHQRPG